jgi:hypothetical protein
MEEGFFRSLFDISFTSFITTKIIKFLYVLALVLIGLGALILIVSAFLASVAAGAFVLLIVAPLMTFLYVIYARVVLEVIIQIFRINEHLRDQMHMQQVAFTNAGWLSATAPAPGAMPPPPSQMARAMPVVPPPPPPPPVTPTCPNCGSNAVPGQKFCRNCGTPIA